MSRVLISSLPGELRLARLENSRLAELRIEYGRGGGETGDIHLGRVTSLDRKIKAAFCDIGQEEDAFLPLAGAPQGLSEGDLLPLVVTRAASGGKGPKVEPWGGPLPESLSAQKTPTLLLRANDPVTALLEDSDTPEEVLLDDPALLNRLKRLLGEERPALLERLALHSGATPLFESRGVEAEIEALLQPEVPLAGGGRLWIEPTHALTAIDLDAGGSASPAKVNLAAVGEIARQIRLRALAGIIAIDFLDPEGPEERTALRQALEEALAGDPARCELQRLSGTGLLLMTRQRLRPALHEILCEQGRAWRRAPRSQAYEALRALRSAALETPQKRPVLYVSPALRSLLEGEAGEALAAVETTLGQAVELRPLSNRATDDRAFEPVLE
ncbi:ribonuclease E/G [Limibacillus halophilus]